MLNLLPEQEFKIYALSEQAVTLSFGNQINKYIASKISRFNKLLNKNPFEGFITSVPAYTTITVFYDLLTVFKSELQGNNGFEKVSSYLVQLTTAKLHNVEPNFSRISIPVCYGNHFGYDLNEVAKFTKLSTAEIIKLHSSVIYSVYMIGFIPGFAYLGGMDERLAMPRKATPIASVPPGSVGIAGKQTGIYPMETPGGWQIIGQTPVKLFDVSRLQPSLLKAGDEVKFEPISLNEFQKLAAK